MGAWGLPEDAVGPGGELRRESKPGECGFENRAAALRVMLIRGGDAGAVRPEGRYAAWAW
ncbi:hypothetical protein ARGLB_035_00540 [Arthrobacter globiformis NBRC 12137]|uniref:Uncharacterized protein n=1 Tax=Arthrobacter globiformis (strain ATCC 8010 / DSM 20124 / JCM 1332 / NBRC 12137 / NCIMB 8907 / NRRL B-2979 / 168) TaxID=1077972 RepID=H0QJT8_ARTG1|nr:hypothetical protein ARGLB_035_00540 [Arthrobacter globiformis NBRC 12137]